MRTTRSANPRARTGDGILSPAGRLSGMAACPSARTSLRGRVGLRRGMRHRRRALHHLLLPGRLRGLLLARRSLGRLLLHHLLLARGSLRRLLLACRGLGRLLVHHHLLLALRGRGPLRLGGLILAHLLLPGEIRRVWPRRDRRGWEGGATGPAERPGLGERRLPGRDHQRPHRLARACVGRQPLRPD